MENNINKSVAYIRKNRADEAIIYLKENDQKAAQKLLCYIHATDNGINVLGETMSLEEVKDSDCNIMLIASASVLTRDEKEYHKIENELKRKGIKIEVAGNNGRIGDYIDMMLQLSRNRKI